jgi:subfamily B ATP-binding cassette protein MsbA
MKEYIRLLKFLKGHIGILTLAILFMLLFGIFEKVSLGTIIPLIDNILSGRDIIMPGQVYAPHFITELVGKINILGRKSPLKLLYWVIGIGTILMLLREVSSFFKSYFMRDVSERVVRDIKDAIYNKLLSLSLDFYCKNPTGKLVSRITYDATLIRDSITTGLMDLLDQPIQIIIGFFIIATLKFYFNISWLLIFLSVVLLPAILYPVRQLGRKLKKLSRQSQEKMGDINVTLYETISGIRVVKAFSMESYESDRVKKQNYQFYKLNMKSIKRMEVISPLSECAIIICIPLIAVIAGRDIIGGELSAGAFGAFLAAAMLMAKPLKRLAKVYGVLQTALAAGKRIFEVLDEEPKVIERPNARVLSSFKEEILFDNVSFRYDDVEVLKDISFIAKKGDVIALVGPSGVGKTTLVNLIPRFYDATSGVIKIDNSDIRDITLKSLRDQIGIVTQETILFNDTVNANIGYGKADGLNRDGIIQAAEIANAHDFIMKMPNGYDTVIGERGFRLSGGEKQRLAIARAVFKNPPILILDEATSQLDTESEILVQKAIDRLMQGRTVFVIAHRLSTVRNATKIIVLDEGRIAESGTHNELLERSGLYKKLYKMQFRDT